MRKIQWFAVIYTLMLALPLTVVAMFALVYLTDYITDLGGAITGVVNWDRLALEGSARWPELAGMVAGQFVILGILLIVRRDKHHDTDSLVDMAEQTRAISERPVSGYKSPPNQS
ncbi:MAG TPA: hypothetical protein VFF59_01545 [Anaerolineae bacterium]|nr:hypothetical protein [Anaerolineae bacterium]